MKLVIGLGNPGSKYAGTRHNLGFLAVRAFAEKHGWPWKSERRFKGEVARGMVGEESVLLLLPMTYMNLSGGAVQKALAYYKVSAEELLVVVDDVYVKLGEMRLRAAGSSGGHNGLKSIEACLGTQGYPRLRMGVGPNGEKDLPNGYLEDYVLGNFTAGERERLPTVSDHGCRVIDCWLAQGVEPASQLAGDSSKKNGES